LPPQLLDLRGLFLLQVRLGEGDG